MKIKLDENLPTSLKDILCLMNHDVDTVFDEQLQGHDDPSIYLGAQKDERLLITQDLDFSDIRQYLTQGSSGVMLIRLKNPSRKILIERIKSIFENKLIESSENSFVVVTDFKIRIRKLNQN